MNSIKGSNQLFLIPTPIARQSQNFVLPENTIQITRQLNCFIVEKIQTAQNFLGWIDHPTPLHQITFRVLNKKTPEHETISFLKLLDEQPVGLLSEAGAPGVADPGSNFIKLVHERDGQVVPLVGPSSILLALMSSGLHGQQFSFQGYLPLDESNRIGKIIDLERDSLRTGFTHIFMETPHRNNGLFSLLLNNLRSSTKLCVAVNLTSTEESISTKSIKDWKKSEKSDLQGKPALFLINAK